MKSRIRSRRNSTITFEELFSFKIAKLWAALKAENISVWMLCFYFLFEYIRPQVLYPVIDVLPWGMLFLLLALLTGITDRSAHIVPNVLNGWFIFFTLIVIVSSFTAFRPAAAFDYWVVFGTWFIIYFLATAVINTERRLLLFLLAYCLFNLKMSQHGMVSWVGRGFSFRAVGLFGSPGWFKNSGEYAIQMLIFGSLAMALVMTFKDYWGRTKKWILYICAASAFIAVVGASSRGAQLGMVGIGLLFILKQKNGFKGLLIVSFLVFVIFHFLPEEQMARFNEMGDDRNSLQRLAYWQYAFSDVIPNYPILGLGYNNWVEYLNFMVPEGMGPMEMNQVIHNIYLQAATDLGLLGLFGFVMLIIYAFVNNARTRKMALALDNKFLFNVSYGLDAGLIGFLIAGTFVTVLYYPFFWVQIMMIVMVNNIAIQKTKAVVKP